MRRGKVQILFGVAAAVVCAALAGVAVPRDHAGSRAPYLQNLKVVGGEVAVTVCWSTSGLAQSELELRPDGGTAMPQGDGLPRHHHRIALGRLKPGTRYEYRVREERGWTPWQEFRSPAADPTPFTFAAFGDFGNGSKAQREVVKTLERHAPLFTVMLGDLAYPSATERALTGLYFRPLANYASGHVVWPVWGNHDVAAGRGRPLDQASEVPENGPAALAGHRNYSWDYGDAHFVVIDSNLELKLIRDTVVPWLDADLKATGKRWKFVFSHHPPFSAGEHGDAPRIRDLVTPVLARRGVTAMFSGHDHLYQRFDAGHPAINPSGAVHYFVSGAGGADLYRLDTKDGRLAASNGRHHGFALVDVGRDQVRVRFIKAGVSPGEAIGDEVTIQAPVDSR